ncbi:MAG: hypothetical protein SGARI_003565 [Bacillariaceae sp.]
MFTALHNVAHFPKVKTHDITALYWDGDGLDTFVPRFSFHKQNQTSCHQVKYGPPSKAWFGYDVDSSPVKEGILDDRMIFEQVPSDFKLEPGMRVGIIYNSIGLSKTASKDNIDHRTNQHLFSQEQLDKIYGPGGAFNNYTGTVRYVGPDHFETDMNGFGGCSGAPVFLLEGEHRGKVIGIYGGSCSVHFNNSQGGAIGFYLKPTVGTRVRQLKWLGERFWRKLTCWQEAGSGEEDEFIGQGRTQESGQDDENNQVDESP